MSNTENKDLQDKLKSLEARNAQLESEVTILALRSPLQNFQQDSADEIDLRELWNAIWKGKWLIIAITSVFAVASVLYAISLPNEYKSTAILAPASQSGAGNLSKLAGQFGGLASLAGINLGSGGAEDKSVIAMEIIKTWGFLEKFIEDNNIQAEVFAAKEWNRLTNELSYDTEIYNPQTKEWVREFDPAKGETAEPSSWELYEVFKDRVLVSQDKETGLIQITVEYFSPQIAKDWTDKLIIKINNHIKQQEKKEAENSIAYLTKQIEETKVADMQSVFYQLIEEQTKTLMLAEVSEEYVFKTLSAAKIAEEKSKPKRALICVLGVMLGSMLSALIALVRYFINKKK